MLPANRAEDISSQSLFSTILNCAEINKYYLQARMDYSTLFNYRSTFKINHYNGLAYLLRKVMNESNSDSKLSGLITALYLYLPNTIYDKQELIKVLEEEVLSVMPLPKIIRILVCVVLQRLNFSSENLKRLEFLLHDLENPNFVNAVIAQNVECFIGREPEVINDRLINDRRKEIANVYRKKLTYVEILPNIPNNRKEIRLESFPNNSIFAAVLLLPLVKDAEFSISETWKFLSSELSSIETSNSTKRNIIFILYALLKFIPENELINYHFPNDELITLESVGYSSKHGEDEDKDLRNSVITTIAALNSKFIMTFKKDSIITTLDNLKNTTPNESLLKKATLEKVSLGLRQHSRIDFFKLVDNCNDIDLPPELYEELDDKQFYEKIRPHLSVAIYEKKKPMISIPRALELICKRSQNVINEALDTLEIHLKAALEDPFGFEKILPLEQTAIIYSYLLHKLRGTVLKERITKLQNLCLAEEENEIKRNAKISFYGFVLSSMGRDDTTILENGLIKLIPVNEHFKLMCSATLVQNSPTQQFDLLCNVLRNYTNRALYIASGFVNCLRQINEPEHRKDLVNKLLKIVDEIVQSQQLEENREFDLILSVAFLQMMFVPEERVKRKEEIKNLFIACIETGNQDRLDKITSAIVHDNDYTNEFFNVALDDYKEHGDDENLANFILFFAKLAPRLIGNCTTLIDKIHHYDDDKIVDFTSILTIEQTEIFINSAIQYLKEHEDNERIIDFLFDLFDRLILLSNENNVEERRVYDLVKVSCLEKLFTLNQEVISKHFKLLCLRLISSIRKAPAVVVEATGAIERHNPVDECYKVLLKAKNAGIDVKCELAALIPKLSLSMLSNLEIDFVMPRYVISTANVLVEREPGPDAKRHKGEVSQSSFRQP